MARGSKRNGQLHSADLLQARLPGSLQVQRQKFGYLYILGGQYVGELFTGLLLPILVEQTFIILFLEVGRSSKKTPFIFRWKSYTAPEKTVLMTNVQVEDFEIMLDFLSGQRLPTLPEGREQTRLDVG